uniref:Uncharacterized protein n=1 Tax=Globisporangium ultimum (strain ATCC 200006 / CBS 805.95 / DAOM BR144) TaxID=431595 RepID=K3WV77_GLOUD
MSIASSKSDGLAELEAELSRDIYSSIPDPANQTEKSTTARKQARGVVRSKPLTEITTTTSGRKRSRAQSVASVDSVGSAVSGLTDLQAELDASSSLVRTRRAGSANVRSSTHNAQSDAVASSTDSDEIDESDDGLAELEAELEAEVGASEKKKPATRQVAKKTKTVIPRAASKRAAVREPKANDALAPVRRRKLSDAVSIATESDGGLAALQVELELSVEAVPMSKPAARPTRATTRQLPKAVAAPVEQKKQMRRGIAAQRTQNGSDQVSIASESDNGLAALQAELDMLVAEVRTAVAVNLATTQASQGKSASKKASAQRSRRAFSDVASIATESDDGLRELQAELELSAMEAPAVHAAVATKPATRASRSKKAMPPAAVSQKIHPRGIAARTRKRTFDAASIATESDDGLAELQAELVMGAEERPSFDAVTTSPPAGRARARRAAKGQATEPLLQKSPGIAARLTNDAVSIATLESDDGLAELEAELEFSSAVEPAMASAPAKAKRSAKRARTSNLAENPSGSKTATAAKRQSTSRSIRPGSSADGMVPPTRTPAPRRTRAAASTQKSTTASQKPKPVKTTAAKKKFPAAATEAVADKAPTRRQKQTKAALVAPRQSRKNEQPTTNVPSPSQQLQPSRHAAPLLSAARSVASDDESDGLDNLEAELQTFIV